MKLRDILFEGAREHEPTFEPDLGVRWVDLQYTLTYEEEAMLKEYGIDISRMRAVNKRIPIVYSHTLTKKGNEAMMDALKMRSKTDVMNVDKLQVAIDKAVNIALKSKMTGDFIRDDKKTGVSWFQRVAANPKDVVIAPIPSSSPLTMMIAESLSKATGHPIIKGFSKNHFPKISSKIKTRDGYRDRGPANSPARKKSEWEGALIDIHHQIEAIEAKPDPTDADIEKHINLSDQAEKIQQQMASYRFQKKNAYDVNDMARGLYGYMDPSSEAFQAKDKYVIIVDDNVVTSETIAEAIKSLLRHRIVPTAVVGFAMHAYN